VVAKGYLTKLVSNEAVKSYIGRHAPEILEHFELVVNTVSMEEALQQQEAEEAASGVSGQDASASIAAYVAETMGDGAEMDPEIDETGHGTHLDMAGTEPADAEDVSLPDGIAPGHGTTPVEAAE